METQTRYARSGDIHVAYQVFGNGAIDLVLCHGFVSNVEAAWDNPIFRGTYEALSSFARVVTFDKRGTGLSDPVTEAPTFEERMDDVRAVMDAVGLERAALLGLSEGGPMSILFAATYPERVTHLVLYGTTPSFVRTDRFPHVYGPEAWELWRKWTGEEWGTGNTIFGLIPSAAHDPRARTEWAKWERTGASPAMAVKLADSNYRMDVVDVLPTVSVPTLVLHSKKDIAVPVECGRYLRDHIPGAKYVEFDEGDHVPWAGEAGPRIVEEVQEFLTGTRPAAEPDRVLSTIVLADICGSTEQAARVGDKAWRQVLDNFEEMVRRQVTRFQGRPVKFTGDGALATFDGPARAVRSASALVEEARRLDLRVRAGVHTGECELRGDDIGGIAVHIASRIADAASPEEVLVSSTVKDLVTGSGLQFQDRGMHSFKGVPDEWRLLSFAGAAA